MYTVYEYVKNSEKEYKKIPVCLFNKKEYANAFIKARTETILKKEKRKAQFSIEEE